MLMITKLTNLNCRNVAYYTSMITKLTNLNCRNVTDGDFLSGLDLDLCVEHEVVVGEDDVGRVRQAGVRQQTEGREQSLKRQ